MAVRWIRFAKNLALFSALMGAVTLLAGGLSAQGPNRPGGRDVVNGHEAVANEVLVRFRTGQSAAERAQTAAIVDADEDADLPVDRVRRIHSRRFDTATLINYFLGAPNVEYAEPNYILYAIATPNDPSFGQLWGLFNSGQTISGQTGTAGADIDAKPAWDVTTGSKANVVGVVDTGVDYNHPDLAANIWSAPAEFTLTITGYANPLTCGINTHGFRSIGGVISCYPLDDHDHGSHVSGTIGAVGNNGVGVAGVNWTASIMGLKFLNAQGSGSTTDAINVFDFAIKVKAHFAATSGANVRILSNSWGGGGFNQTLLNKINEANANNMLFVAAAGNSNSNNDAAPFYPASYTAANVVAVAATDNQDNKASFSSYGATTVDLGAPGVSVLSTTRNNSYAYFSGTSMATPHVSGAAALILSKCALDTAALKNNILNNVDLISSMSGITVTGGRLNVNKALTACNGAPPTAPPAPTGLTATGGNNQVVLSWNASSGATSYNVKRSTTSGGPYGSIGSPTTTGFTDAGAVNGTTYYYVVTAVNAIGESGNSNQASATPSAPPAIPAAPTNLNATAGPGRKKITVTWNASTGATSYRVYRSPNGSTSWSQIATVTGTSYQNSGLSNHTTYYYRVTAVNGTGESAPSNVDSATTP